MRIHAVTAFVVAAVSFAIPCRARAEAAAPAPAAAAVTWSIDSNASKMTYYCVHKLHKFDGTSKKVEGKARLLPDGNAQVMVRVPVESFDSANVNRDEHMKETVEAARFPHVEIKAVFEGVAIPATFPSSVAKTAKAQLTFHGVTNAVDVPVKITFDSAAKATVTTQFGISLEAFKIERPSLMFVKVDDEMKLDATLVFTH